MTRARCTCVGLGPGDPELMTLKAARVIAAAPVVAFFAKRGRPGHARTHRRRPHRARRRGAAVRIPVHHRDRGRRPALRPALTGVLRRQRAGAIADRLDGRAGRGAAVRGRSVLLRLVDVPVRPAGRRAIPTEVVPGVTGMSGCWAAAAAADDARRRRADGAARHDGRGALAARLAASDAAVIMKVGRNLPKIRAALAARRAGRRAPSMSSAAPCRAAHRAAWPSWTARPAPYFSLVLVPGRQRPR